MGGDERETAPIHDNKAQVRGRLDLSGAHWYTSMSGSDEPIEGDGPEYAFIEHTDGVTYTALRNAADPHGKVLVFTPGEWEAFVAGARDGEFDS